MNINQMHIAVQQGVDKINSHHSDLMLPEEIDLELNKNIQRFINQRFNSRGNKYQVGFEESQKRIDDIRTLIVEQSVPCFFKGQVFDGIFAETCEFPADYMHLINLKTLVRNQQCKTFCYDEAEIVIVSPQVTYYIGTGHAGCLGYPNPVFNNFILFYEDENLASIPATVATTGVTSASALIAWVTNPSNWIGDITIVDAGGQNVVLTINGASTPPHLGGTYAYTNLLGGEAICYSSAQVTRNAQYATKRTACSDTNTNTLVGQNKFTQHDDIFKLLSDPFNTTTYKSPLYTIRDSSLDIYTDDTFIVEAAKMTYLKRPATVDFGNTVNCDLPVSVHQEVVDMTVNTILEGISDPRYQSTNMEVLKSE
jgi:hypothetical protein